MQHLWEAPCSGTACWERTLRWLLPSVRVWLLEGDNRNSGLMKSSPSFWQVMRDVMCVYMCMYMQPLLLRKIFPLSIPSCYQSPDHTGLRPQEHLHIKSSLAIIMFNGPSHSYTEVTFFSGVKQDANKKIRGKQYRSSSHKTVSLQHASS